MTTTDELRRILDERGVEWWQSANTLGCIFTRWYSPLFGDEVCAMENGDEGLVLFDHYLTPAQAIAATVGRDEGESYDAGFTYGVKATLQQLYGLLHEYPTLDEIEAWADSQWEEYE